MRGREAQREREKARRLSDEIDRVLADTRQQARGEPLLETARRLGQIVDHLPPVPEELERRVRAIVLSPADVRPRQRLGRSAWLTCVPRRLHPAVWGALSATLVFLVVWFSAPSGQEVWAEMVHALLGQTRVELTPTIVGETRSVREPLRDLVAAELLIGRAPSLPRTLPDGYVLQEIAAVSYPDLPSWISQPFFIELCYGIEDGPSGLCLRQYRLLFRQVGGISGVQVAGDAVVEFEQVEIAGATGSLLTLSRDTPVETYTVLWERDGLLLELKSDSLSKEELLQVARSVR